MRGKQDMTREKKEKKVTKEELQELTDALIKNNKPSSTLDFVLDTIKTYD